MEKLGDAKITAYKPRDRKDLSIVDCPQCGHRQLFPLLSSDELLEEYNLDKTVRTESGVHISPGSGFEAMKTKFKEWTRIHADMYWEMLQKHERVMNLGSEYGFLEEEFNKREGRLFEIEGNER